MKFRPQLESLDGRVLPDAAAASIPITPPPPIDPGDLQPGPINWPPCTTGNGTLQDRYDRYDQLISEAECVKTAIGGISQQIVELMNQYIDLTENADQYIALLGGASYNALLDQVKQSLIDLSI